MTKIYIVTARYSDWEYTKDVLIGVFNDEALARQARDDWEKTRTVFMESEPPFSDEDYEADLLTLEQWGEQFAWHNRVIDEADFKFTNIEEQELNKYIPWTHQY
jgi:hypothetical protein